jgi:hypothetical protein
MGSHLCQEKISHRIGVTKKPSNRFDQEQLERPVTPFSPANSAIALPPSPRHPGSSIMIDGQFSLTENQSHHDGTEKESTKGGRCTYMLCAMAAPTVDWCDVARVTVDMLPDVALLRIFDFYLGEARMGRMWFGVDVVKTWSALVHVCQKWRIVVFGSPRRLDLRLVCTIYTPVRDSERLDIWPLLPIAIRAQDVYGPGLSLEDNILRQSLVDNIVARLDESNDRICSIYLRDFSSSLFEKVLAAMQQPFPALTSLCLCCHATPAVVPVSFLGESARGLQALSLTGFSFPGVTKLLLSATHLVRLELMKIPHSGYISPEAMVTCLSVSTRLENLVIEFESFRSRPDYNIRRPPTPACILPVLNELQFKGADKYLDDFVARIVAPLLSNLTITLFHQLIFDTPHLNDLTRLISRTPNFKAPNKARVVFSEWGVLVKLWSPWTLNGTFYLGNLCSQSALHISPLARVCSSSFQPLIPAVERLHLRSNPTLRRQDETEGSQWLELLRPFTSVKRLYISRQLIPHIVPALQEIVGEGLTEVLPALETLSLEEPLPSGPVRNTIEQFVAARRLVSRPIVVSRW